MDGESPKRNLGVVLVSVDDRNRFHRTMSFPKEGREYVYSGSDSTSDTWCATCSCAGAALLLDLHNQFVSSRRASFFSRSTSHRKATAIIGFYTTGDSHCIEFCRRSGDDRE